MGIVELDGKYSVISCEDETKADSKSTISQISKDSTEVKKVKDFDHRILNMATLDDGLVFLSLDEIWIYDKDFKLKNIRSWIMTLT